MTNAEIADTYLESLRSKDPRKALLAPGVKLRYPLAPHPVVGRQNVIDYIASVLPAFDDVEVERHIVDGEYVATLWTAKTAWGDIPVCSVFRIVGGEIAEVHAYFDPRPIVH